ncbi:MAG: hypothetical protein ACE5FU_14275, partial [Nitrospinota bacterium]
IRDPYLLKQFAHSLRKTGALKKAVKIYNELILFAPNETEAYKNAGIIYELLLDSPKKAIPLYEKYIEQNGSSSKAVQNWLRISREKVKKKESAKKL